MIYDTVYKSNKHENIHRFALSAIRGEILKRERKEKKRKRKREKKRKRGRGREKEREIKIVLGYYTRVTHYP